MIHLKITPDSRLDNKNVEHIAQSLCLYLSPLERWNGKGFNRSPFISFETILEKENTSICFNGTKEMESLAKKSLETAWPKSAIETTTDPLIRPTYFDLTTILQLSLYVFLKSE
jgi:hypothetical protein